MHTPFERVFLSLASSLGFPGDLRVELSHEDILADLSFGRDEALGVTPGSAQDSQPEARRELR